MLPLDSPDWSKLTHAYGPATDIPPLLRQLSSLSTNTEEDPWDDLWSALAHQSDVYPASYAAVPHVVAVLSIDPSSASGTFFQFPAWIEICRQKNGTPIPETLSTAYFDALARLPTLVAAAAVRPWDDGFLQCALAALAAAKGSTAVAEAALELSPSVAAEFLEWFYSR